MRWLLVLVVACHTPAAAPAPGPKPEPEGFDNVTVLAALSRDQLVATMETIKASTGLDCTECHDRTDYSSDDKPTKLRAREMLRMVDAINTRSFGGRVAVTCWTCHRGARRPGTRTIAPLSQFPTELTAATFTHLPPAAFDQPAEQVFVDIHQLAGSTAKQLGLIMQWFTQELGVTCSFCHDESDYAADSPHKRRAREMLDMVVGLGKDFYEIDKNPIMCGTCHGGDHVPATVPSVAAPK